MLVYGKARPPAAIYDTITRELQLAIGYAIDGTETPERAVDDAWNAVVRQAPRCEPWAGAGSDHVPPSSPTSRRTEGE